MHYLENNELYKDSEFISNPSNINSIYETIKNVMQVVLSKEIDKNYKYIFSKKNNIIAQIICNKYLIMNQDEIILLHNDLNDYCKELILTINEPFVFMSLELLLEKINGDNKYSNTQIEKKQLLITIIINAMLNLFYTLRDYNFGKDKGNKKANKYYLRGIIKLLVIIHKISEMKDEAFSKDPNFMKILYGVLNIINNNNIIYLTHCIKIDDIHGKMICEMIFDSIFCFMITNDNKENKKLIHLFEEIFCSTKFGCQNFFLLIDIIRFSLDKKNKYFKEIDPSIKYYESL